MLNPGTNKQQNGSQRSGKRKSSFGNHYKEPLNFTENSCDRPLQFSTKLEQYLEDQMAWLKKKKNSQTAKQQLPVFISRDTDKTQNKELTIPHLHSKGYFSALTGQVIANTSKNKVF